MFCKLKITLKRGVATKLKITNHYLLQIQFFTFVTINFKLEKTEGAIRNGQSRDTGNIRHTRHRTDNPETLAKLGIQDNPETLATRHTKHRTKTIQRHWQHQAYKTIRTLATLGIKDNPETLATLGIQDNPETLATLGIQDTG